MTESFERPRNIFIQNNWSTCVHARFNKVCVNIEQLGHLNSLTFFVWFVLLNLQFSVSCFLDHRWGIFLSSALFVLQITTSDYPFGIFIQINLCFQSHCSISFLCSILQPLFVFLSHIFWPLHCLSFELRLLITVSLSSNFLMQSTPTSFCCQCIFLAILNILRYTYYIIVTKMRFF